MIDTSIQHDDAVGLAVRVRRREESVRHVSCVFHHEELDGQVGRVMQGKAIQPLDTVIHNAMLAHGEWIDGREQLAHGVRSHGMAP
jgi:hypothetical protein